MTRPDKPNVRAPQLLDFRGELLTRIVLIGGGVFAYGDLPGARGAQAMKLARALMDYMEGQIEQLQERAVAEPELRAAC